MSPPRADMDDRDNVQGAADLTVSIGFTLGRQLFSALIQVLTVLVIARWLGPEGNGQYALSVLVPTFLCTLLTLGIPAANVFFVGRADVGPRETLRSNLRIWALLSLVGIVGAAGGLAMLSARLFPEIPAPLLFFGLAAFPPMLLQTYLVTILQGLKDFRRFNTALLAGPLTTLACVLGAWLLTGSGVKGALFAYAVGQLVAVLVTHALVKGSTADSAPKRNAGLAYAPRALSYGSKAYLSNLLMFLNYRGAIFLLNLFVGPATAGIYVVAVQIVERLWMLSIGVNAVVFPQLAGHYKDQRTQSNLTPVAARWVLAVTGTAAFLLALVAYPLVHVLLGTDYRGAVLPLIVLSPGVAALSFSRVLSSDLAARGRVDLNLYLAAGALVVNLLANLLLIPGLGAFGAALATTLTYCADALARVFLFSRFSGLPWWQPILLRRSDWGLARTLLPSVLAATRRRSR